VIVLFDPTSDAGSRFIQAAILGRPHFLFLQAAMEPFDVAVALRVMTSRRAAAVRDTAANARATASAAERADQVIPCFEIARRLAAR